MPITGSRPTTKVTTTRVLASGTWMPISGSRTSRKIAVNKVLISEILICANTMLWNAPASRWQRRLSVAASGPI